MSTDAELEDIGEATESGGGDILGDETTDEGLQQSLGKPRDPEDRCTSAPLPVSFQLSRLRKDQDIVLDNIVETPCLATP